MSDNMLGLNALFWLLLQSYTNAMTYAKRSRWLSSVDQPDAIKTYSSEKHLFASRVFRSTGLPNTRMPLVIRIHGGGFIMNSPAADDQLARYLAANAACTVISMDYSKAPLHPFPAAYEDLIEQTSAAIQDIEENIDPDRVVLCGSSSGGNLALAIAQDSRLRCKLLGVIALTPIVDLAQPLEEKMASRPDPDVPDFLAPLYETMKPLYIGSSDVGLGDVRLSPSRFAEREDLPRHLYLISAEHDLLSKEAESMAAKLALGKEKRRTQSGWHTTDVRWDLIKGQKHGFENFPVKDKQLEQARIREVDALFCAMAVWLRKVFDVPEGTR